MDLEQIQTLELGPDAPDPEVPWDQSRRKTLFGFSARGKTLNAVEVQVNNEGTVSPSE